MKKVILFAKILTICSVLVSCTSKQNTSCIKEKVPIKISSVKDKVLITPISITGKLDVSDETWLSFKLGGVIDKIYVKKNACVKRGDICASLNLTEINAQIEQSHLSLEKARRDWDRVKELFKDSTATLEQLQNAKTTYDLAKRSYEIMKFNHSFSQIIAPFDGIITEKKVNEGEIVAPSYPVFLLRSSNKNNWIVKGNLTDRDRVHLAIGDSASIIIDAYPQTKLKGHISNLGEMVDPNTNMYSVEVEINNPIVPLVAGLFCKMEIFPSKTEIVREIPIDALIEGNKADAFVYVLDSLKMVAHKEKVSIIDFDDSCVYISKQFKFHNVIISGSTYLSDKSQVKIIN